MVGGEIVGWGWAELSGSLDLLVDPGRPDAADAVLEWFAARTAGAGWAVVYPVHGHPKAAGAIPLYRDLGFEPYARTVTFTKKR